MPIIAAIDIDSPLLDELPAGFDFKAFSPGRAQAPQVSERIGPVAVVSLAGRMSRSMSLGRVFGITSQPTTDEVVGELHALAGEEGVSAVVLRIESGGGGADTVEGLTEAIAAIRASGKTVVSSIDGRAGSAAYWVASQTDRIYAGPTSLVGGIGSFAVLEDTSEAQEKVGVKKVLVTDGGKVKGLGADGKITEELVEDVKRVLVGFSAQFVSAVAKGRGVPESKALSWKTGQSWLAEEAKTMGLIDEVRSFRSVVQTLARGETRMKPEQKESLLAEDASEKIQALETQVSTLTASISALVEGISEERKAREQAEKDQSLSARSHAIKAGLDRAVSIGAMTGADREILEPVLAEASDDHVNAFLESIASRATGQLVSAPLPASETVANPPAVPKASTMQAFRLPGTEAPKLVGVAAYEKAAAEAAKVKASGADADAVHAAYRAAFYQANGASAPGAEIH